MQLPLVKEYLRTLKVIEGGRDLKDVDEGGES